MSQRAVKLARRAERQEQVVAAAARPTSIPMALAVCFFLSGAGSLILEVVWTRLLRLVFGSTTLAVSTILVAYMLGLGLGGLVGGRLARRVAHGVRAYGWIEIAAGVYALLVPVILSVMPLINREVLHSLSFWPAAFARLVVVLVILLMPTLLMGATLPILVGALVRRDTQIARRVGLLYGVNTLGAVAGTFAATFLLFPALGVWRTNVVGALLDVAVGSVALLVLAPRFRPEASPAPTTGAATAVASTPGGGTHRFAALAAYSIVGFTALVYEVSWTRALAMILGSSIYAFATMLAAFLSGIALGSLVARRWFDRLKRPMVAYAGGIALLGLLSLATVLAFRALPGVFVEVLLRFGTTPAGVAITNVCISILAMIGPTLVLGALFPLLVRSLASNERDAGAAVGSAYFANTLGSASGALAAGFLLIPALGLQRTMALAIAADFATAAAVLLVQRQWRGGGRAVAVGIAGAAAVLIAVVEPSWSPEQLSRGVYKAPMEEFDVGVHLEPLAGTEKEGILFYNEGINTTVSVHRHFGTLILRVNGKTDASSGRDMATQVLIGQIAMLFGAVPERALIIGLASAVTVGSVATHETSAIDVVELEPAMVEASHFFDDYNHRPLERANVRVIADDGRNVLAYTDQRYDRILSEPSNPWITGAASLFTREFFAAAHGALKPGGRLLQWVQLYGMPPNGLQSMLAALQSQFRYVYGFSKLDQSGDLLLLAGDEPLTMDELPRWDRLSPQVRGDLQRIGLFGDADLWSAISLGPEDIRRLAAGAEVINSDDNMFVETIAPWSLYQNDTTANGELLSKGHGVMSILKQAPRPLTASELGELASAYLRDSLQRPIAAEFLAASKALGPSAEGLAAEAEMAKADESEALARRLIGEAVGLDSKSFSARRLRAEWRLADEDAAGALEDADMALAARPDDPRPRLIRMKALLALDRAAEAQADAETLTASPYSWYERDVWSDAASVAAQSGDLKKAIERTRRFIASDPTDPSGWYALAEYERASGQAAAATEADANYHAALRNIGASRHEQALRLLRFGQRSDAIELLRSAVEVAPDYEPAKAELERLGAS